MINSFLAGGDFCRLLITFCKQFGPRSGPTVGPDLDLNCLTLEKNSCIFCVKKLFLKKVSRRQQKHEKLPSRQREDVLTEETMSAL